MNAALAKPKALPASNSDNAKPEAEQVVKIDTGKTPINVNIKGGSSSGGGFDPSSLLDFASLF